MDIYIPTIEMPAFTALQATLDATNRIYDQLNVSRKVEQLVQKMTSVNTIMEEFGRTMDRLTPKIVYVPARPNTARIVSTRVQLHAGNTRLDYAQVDEITYLMAGQRLIPITNVANKPSKAIMYIVDHLEETIDYAHFYEDITDPERGKYSTLWQPTITDPKRISRAKATLNQLYTYKGFSDVLTIHFKEDHFYVTQKK